MGLLVAGIVFLALGLVLIVRPVRLWAGLAAVLGAILVAAALGLSLPGKASAADTMNDHLKPVYTAEMLTGAGQALTVVGAMGQEMQTKMLPELGQQLGMDQAQLQSFFQENLPAMAAGMKAMPDSMGRFDSLLKAFQGHLADYDTLQPVRFVPIVWMMIIGGILVLLAGAWGFVVARTREVEKVAAPAFEPAERPVLVVH